MTGTNTHVGREGETTEAQLEFEKERIKSEGAIGGAQRKEDRKKY